MLINKYNFLKEQFYTSKDWMIKHPKKVYGYLMVILTLSFGLIFIQYFYFTPKISTKNNIPNMYSESDQVKAKMDESEKKMETVVKELQLLKTKREKGPLTKNDSLRIEYLFNQYQTLKNGH